MQLELEIREQTAIYYQKLYAPRILSTYKNSWTSFIEQQIYLEKTNTMRRNITTEKSPYKKLKSYKKPKI